MLTPIWLIVYANNPWQLYALTATGLFTPTKHDLPDMVAVEVAETAMLMSARRYKRVGRRWRQVGAE